MTHQMPKTLTVTASNSREAMIYACGYKIYTPQEIDELADDSDFGINGEPVYVRLDTGELVDLNGPEGGDVEPRYAERSWEIVGFKWVGSRREGAR